MMGLVMHTTYRFFKPLWRVLLVQETEKLALKSFMTENKKKAKEEKKVKEEKKD